MLGMDVAYVSEIVGDDMLDGRIPKVTSWNTGAERIFGYSASEAIGHDIIDLIGLPGSEEKMQRSLEAAGAREVLHREGRRRRADGTIIATALTLSPIRDEHGKVILLPVFPRHLRRVDSSGLPSCGARGG
jgi:PAS domain S-box-containing protein